MLSTAMLTGIFIEKKMKAGFPDPESRNMFINDTLSKLDMFLLLGRIDTDQYNDLVAMLGVEQGEKKD